MSGKSDVMQQRTVHIGHVAVGECFPVRIAAEIGTYFNKEMDIAQKYVDIAKELGCDFLKGEVLHDLSIIHDSGMPHTYQTDHGPKTENYRALLERKRLPLKSYEKIYRYAIAQGFPVIASVYDKVGVDFLVSIGASAVKVASQNITNRPLIEHCAQSGLPLIMDTGNAFHHEIAEAVYWAETAGVKGLILHHRPDGSPCPAEKHNMRILSKLQEFSWPVGLSCHYDGDEMIYLAIGMGARLIEKPLYHKSERDDQDTMFTMTREAFSTMVRKVRNCSAALGKSERTELIPYQLECRYCIVADKPIGPGVVLTDQNVRFAWPMQGISAAFWNNVKGRVTVRAVAQGKPIQWEDLQGVYEKAGKK